MARHAAHHALTLAFQRVFPNYLEGQDIMKTLPSTTSLPQKMRGFTLIEIAIVLVIVGLLLGGVLKGQEFIENARINRVASDMNNFRAAILTYQDRYGALPGSDAGVARFNIPGLPAGNGNGLWNQNGNNAFLLWIHLRAANLITGCSMPEGTINSYTAAGPCYQGPSSPFGNVYAAWSTTPCAATYGEGNRMFTILPSDRVVDSLDRRTDDGRPATGDLQSAHTPTGGILTGAGAIGGSCFAVGDTYDTTVNRRHVIGVRF